MNKKGFTLIELIAILAILGILLTIIIPNVINVLSDSNEKLYNMQIEAIEDAAKIYVDSTPEVDAKLVNPGDVVNVYLKRDLVDTGILEEVPMNNLTGELFDENLVVKVSLGENNKIIINVIIE